VDPVLLAPPIRQQIQQAAQIDRTLVNERLIARVLGAFAALAFPAGGSRPCTECSRTPWRDARKRSASAWRSTRRAAVLWAVLAESSRMVALGIAIGVPAALALIQLLSRPAIWRGTYGRTHPWWRRGVHALAAASIPA
jgi:hypothetical protein